jgi:hypothetical protein
MKYKLAQMLLQKEMTRSSARHAGKADDPGTAGNLGKNSTNTPGLQFKYCWQSNFNGQMKDKIKFPYDE